MRRIIGLMLVLGIPTLAHADQPEAVRVTEPQLWEALDLERPGLARLKAAVAAQDQEAAASAWAEYFARRTKPTCHFDRGTWPGYIRREFPAVARAILQEAERVAAGDLSHGTIRLPIEGPIPGGNIQWLHNPTKDTNYVSLVGSQWFMNPLGRAYLLTGEERFAETFVWIFESWFDRQDAICESQGELGFNPIYRAYYPGIQSRILVDNYYSMAQSPALGPAVHVKVMRQLLACARFLERQERAYRKGNQQVAAVLGLGIIGLVFPEFKDAKNWVERAETIMAEHLEKDFFADGGHRELCTQYHKTCLRDISYVALTSEHNGRPSPLLRGQNGKALERACDWLARLVMPTGETPPLHSAVFSTDHAVYSLISAIHFKRPDHAYLASQFFARGEAPSQKAPLAFAVYLLSPPLETSALRIAKPPDYASTHLEPSGLAVMRTGWEPLDRYLVFQYGWANTGHAYPVALSFLLEMNGELIATQAGSPRSYRHPAYRYCHSTMSHQCISIDGESYPSIGGVAPGGRLECCADLPGLWYASAYHEGYKQPLGILLRRQIVVVKEGPVLVIDRVEGGQGHTAQWNFHTPISATVEPDHSVRLQGKHVYRLALAHPNKLTDVRTHRHWAAVLPRDCQPDDCGAEVTGVVLEKPIEADAAHFAVALFEGEGSIQEEPSDVFRLSQGDCQHVVLSGSRETVHDGHRIQAEGRLAVIQLAQGRPVRAWAVEAVKLVVDGQSWLAADHPVTGEIAVPKSSQAASVRVYVSAEGGAGAGDGSSWAAALADVQQGIDQAAGQGGGQVWVARGVYKPTVGDDRNVSFRLRPAVEVYGGFAGTEQQLDERDWEKNRTVLSGDIGRPGEAADNSYHVVIGADRAVLDGFIIAGGCAQGELLPARPRQGGPPGFGPKPGPGPRGLRLFGGPPPKRRPGPPGWSGPPGRPGPPSRLEARGRAGQRGPFGGGRFAPGPPGKPGVAGPVGRPGGGIHTTPQAILRGMRPSHGGGMVNFQSAPTVRNCLFQDNAAMKGGGMYNMTSTSFPPRPDRRPNPAPHVVNCRFVDNWAVKRGGGVANDLGTSPIFQRCVFRNNRCDEKGGGMYNDFSCSPVLENCLFVGNHAFVAGALGNDGGSSPVVAACTLTGNSAEDGGAAIYQGTGPANNPVVIKSIVWGNICQNGPAGILNWHDNQPQVTQSCVEGGYPGESNIEADPQFDQQYRPDANSPCAGLGHTAEAPEVEPPRRAPRRWQRPDSEAPRVPARVKATGTVIYVDASHGDGPWDGRSWATAYRSLAAALEAATAGSEVWVAGGKYLPNDSTQRDASFVLPEGVAVYGGFRGGETERDQRDWEKNVTVLSGDLGRPGDKTDNAYHVVIGADAAVLDGLTIRDGHADGGTYDAKGGGMINYRRSPQSGPMGPPVGLSPEVRNCTFTNNHAVEGGAVYTYDRAAPKFLNCRFVGNSADNGGAVVDRVGVRSEMTGCVFEGNTSRWRAGAVYLDYGARPLFHGCRFLANRSDCHGGAVYLITRASQLEATIARFEECAFTGNAAKKCGGAIANFDHSQLGLDRCVLSANQAGDRGGAVYTAYQARSVAAGCTFQENHAQRGEPDTDHNETSSFSTSPEDLPGRADNRDAGQPPPLGGQPPGLP